MCLKVRLMVWVMSTRSSRVSADPSWRRNWRSPAIDLGGRGQRRDEGRKVRPIFRGVGKRMGSGKILDIGCAEASRHVVDANGAFEAQLRSSFLRNGRWRHDCRRYPASRQVCSASGVISSAGFKHLLVVVVARPQHHPVLAERDRLPIVIGRDVPDSENRHGSSTMMLAPKHAFLAPRRVSRLSIGFAEFDER